MQIDNEGLKERCAKIEGYLISLFKCESSKIQEESGLTAQMFCLIKDQQAQEAKLTAIVKELREALEVISVDLACKESVDSRIAKQALLRAEQIESNN